MSRSGWTGCFLPWKAQLAQCKPFVETTSKKPAFGSCFYRRRDWNLEHRPGMFFPWYRFFSAWWCFNTRGFCTSGSRFSWGRLFDQNFTFPCMMALAERRLRKEWWGDTEWRSRCLQPSLHRRIIWGGHRKNSSNFRKLTSQIHGGFQYNEKLSFPMCSSNNNDVV